MNRELIGKRLREFVQSPIFTRWVLASLTVTFLLLLGLYLIFWMPNTFETEEKVVFVSRGATFKSVVDSLEAQGVLTSRFTFELAGRLLNSTTSLKVGKYVFKSGTSNSELLKDLSTGRSRQLIPLLIPEGVRMRSIAGRAAAALGVREELILALCTDSSFIRSCGLDVPNLEGYLLPDTYLFHWQTDEREIVSRMVQAFKAFYNDSLIVRQKELGMSMDQVITLASIVEGEARLDSERPIIAGVYHNRLKKRMRLQADPTVQYALEGGPRRLLYEDLRLPSSYNTYRIYGLPPGPINNPGRQSILAALYPDSHGYLFFVANGEGGHRFARTYEEHLKNVKSFRRFRRDLQREQLRGGSYR
jgi:UPF0755 protein